LQGRQTTCQGANGHPAGNLHLGGHGFFASVSSACALLRCSASVIFAV